MNNKGFAISIIMYSMVFLLIAILYMILGIMRTRYTVNAKLRDSIIEKLNASSINEATLTVEETSIAVALGAGNGSNTFTYDGDGDVSCSSSNPDYITCSVDRENNSIIVTPVAATEEVITITVTASETDTYLAPEPVAFTVIPGCTQANQTCTESTGKWSSCSVSFSDQTGTRSRNITTTCVSTQIPNYVCSNTTKNETGTCSGSSTRYTVNCKCNCSGTVSILQACYKEADNCDSACTKTCINYGKKNTPSKNPCSVDSIPSCKKGATSSIPGCW